MYDVTSQESFNSLQYWLNSLQNNSSAFGVIVGNKNDLVSQIQVRPQDAASFATSNGYEFVETSASKGNDVETPFRIIAEKFIKTQRSS